MRPPSLFACPNDPPCPHPSLIHDIDDRGDPLPRCCAGGCDCGRPATNYQERRGAGGMSENQGHYTLDAINPGCGSTMAGHRCVRGAGHGGLHYDHDGNEWRDSARSRPGTRRPPDEPPEG